MYLYETKQGDNIDNLFYRLTLSMKYIPNRTYLFK